jgi:hypothetical protein
MLQKPITSDPLSFFPKFLRYPHVTILQELSDTRSRVGVGDLGGLLGVQPDCGNEAMSGPFGRSAVGLCGIFRSPSSTIPSLLLSSVFSLLSCPVQIPLNPQPSERCSLFLFPTPATEAANLFWILKLVIFAESCWGTNGVKSLLP